MVRFWKWLLVAVLLLPVAELAAFIAVAAHIGFLAALALTLAASAAGVALLKAAGRGKLARVGIASRDGETALAGADPFIMLAAMLLALPGFITDGLGVLLLIPLVRQGLRAALGRVLGKPQGPRDDVVDLDRGEWKRLDGER